MLKPDTDQAWQPPPGWVANMMDPRWDLTPWALKELADSGISPETAWSHGVRSFPVDGACRNGSVWYRLLNRRLREEWGELLLFPHFDEDAGSPLLNFDESIERKLIYIRAKLRWPGDRPDGEPKYLAPAGIPARLYFTSSVIAGLLNGSIKKIYVVEGEKKALRLRQMGFYAISLPGVHCGLKPKSKYHLHSDLQRFDWQGVEVVIAFDSDAEHNESVDKARQKLARAFQRAGAIVKIAKLPDGAADPNDPVGAKVGVDDYAVANGDDALRALLTEHAELVRAELPKVSSVAPEELREQYLNGRPQPMVYYHRLHEYVPDERCYVHRPDEEEESLAYKWLCATHQHVHPGHAEQLVRAVKLQLTPSNYRAAPPFWLCDPPAGFENLDECFIARDVVVNLRTGGTTPSTADLFTTYASPVVYDPAAPAPEMFLRHLREVLRHDHQIALLQEFMGLSFTPDTSRQKYLGLFGPPGCGKGTIMRMWARLLGEHNVHDTSLFDFNDKFGLAPAVGKSLLVIGDARLPSDGAVRAKERIDNITGEDAMTVDDKYEKIKSVRLKLKIVVVGNELLNFQDVAGATLRRLLPLKAYGPEDPKREAKDGLSEFIFGQESSGMLNWAIEGWRRVTGQGFTGLPTDGPGQELLKLQRQLGSPLMAFLDEECWVSAEMRCTVAGLFGAWKEWCERNGHHAGSVQRFGTKLIAAAPGVQRTRERRRGEQVSVYAGVGLASPQEQEQLAAREKHKAEIEASWD